jgi:hypothetical protein
MRYLRSKRVVVVLARSGGSAFVRSICERARFYSEGFGRLSELTKDPIEMAFFIGLDAAEKVAG